MRFDNSSIKGPVNSTQDVGMHDMATYLNTNSGATSYGDDEDMEASTTQRAIVGAWMLVKEAAATLAMLVDISPRPSDSTLSSQGQYGVLVSEMSVIGSSLLVALGRLKHMGAIAEVQAALNAVSASLLRFEISVQLLVACPSAG